MAFEPEFELPLSENHNNCISPSTVLDFRRLLLIRFLTLTFVVCLHLLFVCFCCLSVFVACLLLLLVCFCCWFAFVCFCCLFAYIDICWHRMPASHRIAYSPRCQTSRVTQTGFQKFSPSLSASQWACMLMMLRCISGQLRTTHIMHTTNKQANDAVEVGRKCDNVYRLKSPFQYMLSCSSRTAYCTSWSLISISVSF